MIYNVRCCCDPGKVLGQWDAPNEYLPGQYATLHVRGSWSTPVQAFGSVTPHRHIRIEFAAFTDGEHVEVAIRPGEGQDLAFWRTVPGFTETLA